MLFLDGSKHGEGPRPLRNWLASLAEEEIRNPKNAMSIHSIRLNIRGQCLHKDIGKIYLEQKQVNRWPWSSQRPKSSKG